MVQFPCVPNKANAGNADETNGFVHLEGDFMSKLHKAIRSTRYAVKPGKTIMLHLETGTSQRFELKVVDCSATGLCAEIMQEVPHEEMLSSGSIVPAAKLIWDQKEIFLGRLVVRRSDFSQGRTEIALSTIDMKIPVEEGLSHALAIDLGASNERREQLSSEKFTLAHFIEAEFTNVDLFDRIRKFDVFFSDWEKSKKFAYRTERSSGKGARVNLARRRKNGRHDYLVMASNDYLGLASHPEVIEAAQRAVAEFGFSSTGSPATTGLTKLHFQLCEQIASMHNKEAAVLFNSGYAANIGIISSITSPNDLIVADQLSHASIQDATQMTRATSRFFKHNDVNHLDQLLTRERDKHNGCLVVTEGVFSMDGDIAKLDDIYTIARKHNARIMVDQAHCFGVLGQSGLGVCDKFHLLKDVDIIMGTFSKICGGIGGFATGSKELVNWLQSFARSQVFSVSLPPSTVAAVSKSLEVFQRDASIRHRLHANIEHFVRGLESIGYRFSDRHESAIVPVIIGDESKMGEMYQSLLDDGVWCAPIVYPAVSRKNCRFRFTVMATHTVSDLDYAVSCLEKAMIKANFKFSNHDNKAA